MNRKNFFTALICGLLTFGMLGCGTSNHLQSVQLSTSNLSEVQMGTLEVKGVGGTLQLYAWGNYSDGKSVLLTTRHPAWNIVLTPGSSAWTGVMGDPNATPPQTIQLDQTGLMTAVPPWACSFVNTATSGTTPAWGIQGTYTVTASYGGMTSQPAYVVIASAAGAYSPTNPNSLCGP